MSDERTRDLLSKLQDALEDWAKNPEKYGSFLANFKRFHKYSWGNQFLILAQCPHATYLKGYKGWLGLGRKVRKGEKAIWILAPRPYNRQEVNKQGEAVEKRGMYFTSASIFDISQTDPIEGKEDTCFDPSRISKAETLTEAEVEALYARLVNHAESLGLTVQSTKNGGNFNALGWYSEAKKQIYVKPTNIFDMFRTLLHEVAHHYASEWRQDAKLGHACEEVIVESVAYIVADFVGLDSTMTTVPYVGTWIQKDSASFKKGLAYIFKVSNALIHDFAPAEAEVEVDDKELVAA